MLTKHSFLQGTGTQRKVTGRLGQLKRTSAALAAGSMLLCTSVTVAEFRLGSQEVLAAETPVEAVTTKEANIQVGLTDLREDGRMLVGDTVRKTAAVEQRMEEESKEAFAQWAKQKQEEADRKAEEKQKALEEERRRKEEEERRSKAVISYSNEDYQVLLKIVQAEAGICDEKGKILVANVVINRVKSKRFPNSIKSVVYAPKQFSPVGNGSINRVQVTQETVECVNRALAGEDYSQGALFFMNRGKSKQSNVGWFDRSLTYLFYHGNHEFFK